MRNRITFLVFFIAVIITATTGFSPVAEMNVKAPAIHSRQWLNSNPLEWKKLKGKVVMVEFWTFECYNCRNVEPYIKSWYQKYQTEGFEIIAVHTPEFDRERDVNNVRNYLKQHAISYPVAIDNDFSIWQRFSNRYWPAMYIVDKQGNLRYRFIGEGNYSKIENIIRQLIREPG